MAAKPAIVGGFILGALALGVAAILFFGQLRLFTTTTRLVAFFDESVAGLDVGAPVTFQGVRIGSVQSITVEFSTKTIVARVPVVLELDPHKIIWQGHSLTGSEEDYHRLLDAGLRAKLAQQSFVTGQLRVDLDFRPGTPIVLSGVQTGLPEVPVVPSDLSQIRTKLTDLPVREIADDLQRTLTVVERLTEHLNARLDGLSDNASRSMEAATQTLATTDTAVRQLQTDASTTLHHLDGLILDAQRQLNTSSDGLNQTLRTADRAAQEADNLLASLNALTGPRSRMRGDLEATIRDLAASANSLRDFSRTIERNPSAVLTGRSGR